MKVSSRYSYFSNFVVNGSEICSGGATNYHYDYMGGGEMLQELILRGENH